MTSHSSRTCPVSQFLSPQLCNLREELIVCLGFGGLQLQAAYSPPCKEVPTAGPEAAGDTDSIVQWEVEAAGDTDSIVERELEAAGDTESTVKQETERNACAQLPSSIFYGLGYPLPGITAVGKSPHLN